MPAVRSDQHKKLPRSRGRPFSKGQTGNPGGRPRVALAWKERCREFLEREGGWEQLVRIAHGLTGGDPMPALRLLTEYAYGKPTQPISGDLDLPGIQVSVSFDRATFDDAD
jgi:hypothetical protein